jgi:UDP-galactopyranose mutase
LTRTSGDARGGPAIVCFSNLDWDWLKYRKQHLMERLSACFPVVYVNPPRACKWRQLFRRRRTVRHGATLWVHEPLVLPGRAHAAIHRWNDRLIASAIRALVPERQPMMAWVYSPHALAFVRLLRPSHLVYDMADHYGVPSGAHVRDAAEAKELRRLADLEAQLLKTADLVFCASEPLLERARQETRAAHLVPNGCDFDAYAEPMARRSWVCRPRIGYVGTIAPRVDVALLVRLARERPDWDIQVVGPVSPLVDLAHCPTLPNLIWTGPIPYSSVPATIAALDVGILPLLEIPFATQASPIQVYDYLAAGKPVVSTPVAQLQKLPRLVSTATGEGFAGAIERALAIDSPVLVAERRAFARANSWEARVRQILPLLAGAGLAGEPAREVA